LTSWRLAVGASVGKICVLCGTKDTVLKEVLGDVAHDESCSDFPEDGEKHDGAEIVYSGPAFFRRGTSHLHFH